MGSAQKKYSIADGGFVASLCVYRFSRSGRQIPLHTTHHLAKIETVLKLDRSGDAWVEGVSNDHVHVVKERFMLWPNRTRLTDVQLKASCQEMHIRW